MNARLSMDGLHARRMSLDLRRLWSRSRPPSRGCAGYSPDFAGPPSPGCAGYSPDFAGERQERRAHRLGLQPADSHPQREEVRIEEGEGERGPEQRYQHDGRDAGLSGLDHRSWLMQRPPPDNGHVDDGDVDEADHA